VKVKVDNPDEQLRPEMNATLNFWGRSKARGANHLHRVLVPKAAVRAEGTGCFCFCKLKYKGEQRSIRLVMRRRFYYVRRV